MDNFENNRAALHKDFKYGSETYNELAEKQICELRDIDRGAYYSRMARAFSEALGKVAKAEAATSLAQLDEIRIWGEAETKRVWCAFELAMQEKPAEWAILDRDLMRH